MPNRLADEKSPYLRQHAANPVDWLPWGDEARARARAEGKPIFLSIGYSTCHWCHVMAHESFENAAVAAVLNRGFVPVKVDREERPDLDRVYMAYVQHTTGHGGWPMSVWLTPDLKPFFGGTYFPPEDRHGRPGFVTVLEAIERQWREQRPRIEAGAEEVVQALRRYASDGPQPHPGSAGPDGAGEPAGPPLHEAAGEAFEQGFQYFHAAHDARWGGFGGAPKFPRASVIDFLLRTAVLQGGTSDLGQEAIGMAATTLQRMAEGGLHDQVGGGFHRYSVDAEWHVPHFEKMLYDQALIAVNYLETAQATGLPVFGWVARGIFDYVARDLTAPGGGFYSAEDADSALPEEARGEGEQGAGDQGVADGGRKTEDGGHDPGNLPPTAGDRRPGRHAEGAFYVWTQAELATLLGADAAFFCAHFDVKPAGNVGHDPHGEFGGRNVLRQLRSLARSAEQFELTLPEAEEKLLRCLARLREVRARRPRPHRDDKVITAWNGLMISALARGAQVLPALGGGEAGEPRVLRERATRAAEFVRRELFDEATGRLFRSWREGRSPVGGFAEDYACLIQGLLDLYEAGFDLRWLQWAERLQQTMDGLFWDEEHGGYFNSPAGDQSVIVRMKEDYDGAEPAPGSIAALNLIRLEWMLGSGDGGRRTEDSGQKAEDGAKAEAVAGPDDGRPTSGSPAGRMSYHERARRTVEALRGQWSRAPHALPRMLVALEMLLTEPRTVVLAGDPDGADLQALAAVLHARPGPRRALLCADGAEGQRWLASRQRHLAGLPRGDRAAAYLCEYSTCRPPVFTPGNLRALLG